MQESLLLIFQEWARIFDIVSSIRVDDRRKVLNGLYVAHVFLLVVWNEHTEVLAHSASHRLREIQLKSIVYSIVL